MEFNYILILVIAIIGIFFIIKQPILEGAQDSKVLVDSHFKMMKANEPCDENDAITDKTACEVALRKLGKWLYWGRGGYYAKYGGAYATTEYTDRPTGCSVPVSSNYSWYGSWNEKKDQGGKSQHRSVCKGSGGGDITGLTQTMKQEHKQATASHQNLKTKLNDVASKIIQIANSSRSIEQKLRILDELRTKLQILDKLSTQHTTIISKQDSIAKVTTAEHKEIRSLIDNLNQEINKQHMEIRQDLLQAKERHMVDRKDHKAEWNKQEEERTREKSRWGKEIDRDKKWQHEVRKFATAHYTTHNIVQKLLANLYGQNSSLSTDDMKKWSNVTQSIKGSEGINRNTLSHGSFTGNEISQWGAAVKSLEPMVGSRGNILAPLELDISRQVNPQIRKKIERKSGGASEVRINIGNPGEKITGKILGSGQNGVQSKNGSLLEKKSQIESYTHPIVYQHPNASPAMFGNTAFELEHYKCGG